MRTATLKERDSVFRDLLTEPRIKRLLLNRRAAWLLGIATILSCYLVAFRYTNLGISEGDKFALRLAGLSALIALLGALAMLVCMLLFIFKCDQQKRD